MCWLGILNLEDVKSKFDGRMGLMPFGQFKTIFKDIKYTESVLLQGTGEPFLNPEIFDMINYLNDRKFHHIWIISNGSTMDSEVRKEILDSKVSEICVSVDGAKAKTYEEIRKGANFVEVTTNVRELVEEKRRRGVNYPELALIFVALKSNITELSDFVRMAHDIGVNRVDIKEFSMPHPSLTHLCLDNDDRKYFLEALETSKQLGIRAVFYHSLIPELMPTNRQKCYWPWTSLCVTIDGHVTPCWYNLFPEDCSMGNLLEQDFLSVWNSEKYQEFRRRLSTNFPDKPDICKMCPGY
jgi:radical SAM protein with 4Fe4S-binding SPASM domain